MRVIAVFLVWLAATAAHAEKRAAVIVASLGSQPGAVQRVRTDLATAGLVVVGSDATRKVLEGDVSVEADLAPLEALLQAAQESYEGFDLGDALSKLQELDERTRVVDATPALRALLSRRYLLSGLVWSHSGKDQAAITDFRLAHQLSPTRQELERGLFRPSVVAAYARAVAQDQRAPRVRLRIAVDPANAVIWVDGAPLASTREVGRGPHWVEVSAPGYQPHRQVLDAESTTTVEAMLVPLEGAERLASLRRAVIAADSLSAGAADALASALEAGLVVLLRPGSAGAEALVHRRGSTEVASWVVVGTAPYLAAIGTAKGRDAPPLAAATTSTAAQDSSAPWYKEWWGLSLLAGGGAVVATTLFFVLASDSGADSARIEQWCFNQCN